MKLDIKAFALTAALLWAFAVFGMTWFLIAMGESLGDRTWLGVFYRGYTVSAVGSVIGLVWSFFDALIGGVIFAALYNRLARAPRAPEDQR